ncbi:hypothetical protein ACQ4PT_046102 [Festuca glaucescens]
MATRKSQRIASRVAKPEAEQQWCDLAALPSELVEEVAKRLLDNDVADLVCFRLACKLWKNTFMLEPSALGACIHHRFHPHQWIMLPEQNDGDARRMFLNTVTTKTIRIDLPVLHNHAVVAGSAASPEGMLVLRDEDSLVIRVLNPLTGHVINLPSVKTLQRGRHRRGPVSRKFREEHKVTAAGFAGDSNVVIYFGEVNRMAVAKPGDARWTPVRGLRSPVLTTITFQRRFYCIDDENLLVLDMAGGLPRLVLAVALDNSLYNVNMLDNCGKLMVQCRRMQWVSRVSCHRSVILVYEVNLEEGTLMPVHDLAGQAVFAGDLGAVLLPSVMHWPCVEPNAVYFKFGLSQMFGVHRMGRPYPAYRDVVGTLAEYLAMYVTR